MTRKIAATDRFSDARYKDTGHLCVFGNRTPTKRIAASRNQLYEHTLAKASFLKTMTARTHHYGTTLVVESNAFTVISQWDFRLTAAGEMGVLGGS